MRASRDMTSAQFRVAIAKRGWRKVMVWVDIGGGHSIGAVMIGGKINYRAWLAHCIRESKRVEVEKAKSAVPA